MRTVWEPFFCTVCLVSAVISVAMIGPAMDEMLASLQHVKALRHDGVSTWRAFWTGRAA